MPIRIRSALPAFALVLGVAAVTPARPVEPKPAPPAAVPKGVVAFVAVDVAQVWDHPAFGGIRAARGKHEFAWVVQSLVGVAPADLDRVILFWPTGSADAPFAVVRTRRPVDPAAVAKALARVGATGPKPLPGGNVLVAPGAEFAFVLPVDARTLLFAPPTADPAAMEKVAAATLPGLTAAAGGHALAVGIDVAALAGLPLPFGGPLLDATTATLTADLTADLARTKLTLAFPTAAKAVAAKPVLRAKFDELAGYATAQQKRVEARESAASATPGPLLEWAAATLSAAKVEAADGTVVATADVALDEAVSRLLTAVPDSVFAGRGNSAAQNNLKQIGLALHTYLDANRHFPANSYDKAGKPLLSWRVHILPYLEQNALHARFKLDEPWDSPANKPLSETVVRVYQMPGRPTARLGETYFQTFVGPKDVRIDRRPWLVAGNPKGPNIGDIADGISNTVMVVEAATAVSWAKPDDLPYDGVLPLPKLGGPAGTFVAAFGDGSVRTFRRGQLDDKTFRGLITITGGEVVNIPDR